MSQLCTERSLESKKWSNFWDFTGRLLLSGDLSVHNWPIVANIFIRKSTLPILLRVLTSLYEIYGNLIYGTQYTVFWKVLELHKKKLGMNFKLFKTFSWLHESPNKITWRNNSKIRFGICHKLIVISWKIRSRDVFGKWRYVQNYVLISPQNFFVVIWVLSGYLSQNLIS
jgi:hypothetical protein